MTDLFITCSAGIGLIDETLEDLLNYMRTQGDMWNALEADILGTARVLGLLLAYCMAAYYAWEMMLGRKGLDVMKLLRILAISFCITFSPQLCQALASPGFKLEAQARSIASESSTMVDAKLDELRDVQAQYEKKQDEAGWDNMKAIWAAASKDDSETSYWSAIATTWSTITDWVSDNPMTKIFKNATDWLTSLVVEFVQWLIRFIGEIIFQFMYFGLFLAQAVIMKVLALFCPIAFALSLAPPFRNAWSQWIGKYVSVSLWGCLIFIALIYVNHILAYTVGLDIAQYKAALNQPIVDSSKSLSLFLSSSLGSTCMYVMGLCAGAYTLKFVPELASWLIPGGVSSGLGAAGASSGSNVVGSVGAIGGMAVGAGVGAAVAGPMGVAVGSQIGGSIGRGNVGGAVGGVAQGIGASSANRKHN